eukprot:126502-Chlamydomonas_euryale.AAC.1
MPKRARVSATLSLRGSLRKPMDCCSLDLTHDMMMMSFSRPWNASTLLTSTSYAGMRCVCVCGGGGIKVEVERGGRRHRGIKVE